MLPSIELQLTDIIGFNGETAIPVKNALDSGSADSGFADLLYQPLPGSDPVATSDTGQRLPDSGNFLPPDLREAVHIKGQTGELAVDGMVTVLQTPPAITLATQGPLQYETTALQAVSSLPAAPQGQSPAQMRALVDVPTTVLQSTPASLPTAAPLQTNVPVQTEARAPVQSQAQLQPQIPLQAQDQLQTPTQAQTNAQLQTPTQAQTHAQLQAPSQLQSQAQLKVPSQPQTQAQLQAPTQAQSQAQLQAPTHPQTPSQAQTQGQLQTQVPLQTQVQMQVPVQAQKEAQVHAQALAPVVAAEPIARQLGTSALNSSSAAMQVDRDISSGKAVTVDSITTRAQGPKSEMVQAKTPSIPAPALEMPRESRSRLSGAMPDPLAGLAERVQLTSNAQSTQVPAPTVAIAPPLAAINPVATATPAPLSTFIPSPIDVPLQDPAWGNALGDRVLFMTGQKIHQAEIRLNPAEMGPITIRVSVDDGAADVTFTAQHLVARDAIEAAMPRLRELLSENGLSLGNTSVTEQGTEQDRKGSETQQAREESGAVAEGQRTDDSTGQPVTRRHTQGLVDTFV